MDNPDVQLPQIPRYGVEAVIGHGGMATVFLAVQESLARQVALKVMTRDLSRQPEFRKRFLKEGHLIAQLSHPNIVTIYDIGVCEDLHYFSMTYLPGGTLKEKILAGAPIADALGILSTLASALAYAHRQGIVHRDIKPGNVLFNAAGGAVLADFGIAKSIGEETQLTSTGLAFGSVPYMSPEQLQGLPVDHRADLYGLGVLFWQMLTGHLPYQARDPFAIALMHTKAPIPTLPKELLRFQPLVQRLLAKHPEDRFGSAEELIAAIEAIPEPLRGVAAPAKGLTQTLPMVNPTHSRRTHVPEPAPTHSTSAPRRSPWWIALGAIALAALGVGGYLAFDRYGLGVATGESGPDARTSLASNSDGRATDQKLDDLLRLAERKMSEGKYAAPPGDNAFELYRQAISLDPENAQAKQGMLEIGQIQAAERIRGIVEKKLRQGEIQEARQLIQTGLRLNPDDKHLLGLERALE